MAQNEAKKADENAQASITRLEQELSEANTKLHNQTQIAQKLENDLTAAQQDLTQAKSEVQRQTQAADVAQNALTIVENKAKEEADKAEAALDKAERELQMAQNEAKKADENAQASITRLEQELSETNTKLQNDFAEAQQKAKQAESDLGTEKLATFKAQSELVAAQNKANEEAEKAAADLNEAKRVLESAKDEAKKTSQELTILNAKFEALQDHAESLQRELAGLKKEKESLLKEKDEEFELAKKKAGASGANIKNINDLIAKLQNDHEKVLSEMKNLNEDELKNTEEDSKLKSEEFEKEVTKKELTIERLRKRLEKYREDFKSENKELSNIITDLRIANEVISTEAIKINAKRTNLKEENRSLLVENERLKSENEGLQNKNMFLEADSAKIETASNLTLHQALLEANLKIEGSGRERLSKKDASAKATKLLNNQKIEAIIDKALLVTILGYEKDAAEDPAKYCAEGLLKANAAGTWRRLMGGTNPLYKRALLKVCMEKSSYAPKLINALETLLKNSDSKIGGIINELRKEKHKGQENILWAVDDVSLQKIDGKPWLIVSPQYTNAARTELDPDHHSDNFLKGWGETIARGTRFVDITTLSVPEVGFYTELKNSIRLLNAQAKTKPREDIIVRILFGTNDRYVQVVDVRDVLNQSLETATAEGLAPNLKVYVGTYSATALFTGDTALSWNHSKIVAVDGNFMLTGGHNLYESYLRRNNPVHDVSALVPGKLAKVAHKFCNKLWHYTNKSVGKLKFSEIASSNGDPSAPRFVDSDVRVVSKEDPDSNNKQKLIALGRLGNVGDASGGSNPSDTAQVAMIDAAKHSIFISQQAVTKLFMQTTFNSEIIKALCKAIAKEVDVFILKSSINEVFVGKGAFGYGSGIQREDMIENLLSWATYFKIEANAQKIFAHLHVLDTANFDHEVPNHAKVLIVDGRLFYIGSHNHYDDSHAEFGIIGENDEVLLRYMVPLFIASMRLQPTISTLADYKVGDFVLRRRGGNLEQNEEWSIGRVLSTSATKVTVNLNFLNPVGFFKDVTLRDFIVKIPGMVTKNAPEPGKAIVPEDLEKSRFGL
jgi:hypothetical protein